MEDITLTIKDLEKLKVLERLKDKKIKQIDAAKLLGKSERQIRRMMQRYCKQGARSLGSRLRGRGSNHQLPTDLKTRALSVIAKHYADFGPTLAAEKLRNIHGITMAVETVRNLMIEKRLWIPKKSRAPILHLQRARRESEGELVQMDASHHDWFEDRGPKCVLHVAIDDATSNIMGLHFAETESLNGYFTLLRQYIMTHGRPLSVYVDRHSIFKVNNRKDPSSNEEHITQFGRALQDLGINLIHAHSPQAKGRVERVNRTLQDRFIKELRLRGISNMEAANLFAEQYRLEHNRQFGVIPTKSVNLHRPLEPCHQLEKILRPNYLRTIQKDLTFQYANVLYQVHCEEGWTRLRGQSITVWTDSYGVLHAEYRGNKLNIEEFHHLEYQPKITQASAKRWIMKKQRWKPGKNHPYKYMFKIK